MKRGAWLVLVWLVTTALLFVSCAKNAPSAQPEVEVETTTTFALQTTEPKTRLNLQQLQLRQHASQYQPGLISTILPSLRKK